MAAKRKTIADAVRLTALEKSIKGGVPSDKAIDLVKEDIEYRARTKRWPPKIRQRGRPQEEIDRGVEGFADTIARNVKRIWDEIVRKRLDVEHAARVARPEYRKKHKGEEGFETNVPKFGHAEQRRSFMRRQIPLFPGRPEHREPSGRFVAPAEEEDENMLPARRLRYVIETVPSCGKPPHDRHLIVDQGTGRTVDAYLDRGNARDALRRYNRLGGVSVRRSRVDLVDLYATRIVERLTRLGWTRQRAIEATEKNARFVRAAWKEGVPAEEVADDLGSNRITQKRSGDDLDRMVRRLTRRDPDFPKKMKAASKRRKGR